MSDRKQRIVSSAVGFEKLGIPHLSRLVKTEFRVNTMSRMPSHIHPDQFEVCVHYDGQQLYEVEGIDYETQSGDLFFTFPNEQHSSGRQVTENKNFFIFL